LKSVIGKLRAAQSLNWSTLLAAQRQAYTTASLVGHVKSWMRSLLFIPGFTRSDSCRAREVCKAAHSHQNGNALSCKKVNVAKGLLHDQAPSVTNVCGFVACQKGCTCCMPLKQPASTRTAKLRNGTGMNHRLDQRPPRHAGYDLSTCDIGSITRSGADPLPERARFTIAEYSSR
jgi:hypothetical protein